MLLDVCPTRQDFPLVQQIAVVTILLAILAAVHCSAVAAAAAVAAVVETNYHSHPRVPTMTTRMTMNQSLKCVVTTCHRVVVRHLVMMA
jgi:hypothetical protein